MFRILKGKNIAFEDDLGKYLAGFNRVEADIGTGDGRFVYDMARRHKDIFFIGVDPVAENMAEYAAKAARKPAKGGVANAAYIVSAVEDLPVQMSAIIDKIYITLPWGSLLEGVAKGSTAVLENLSQISKPPRAEFEFCLTYSILHEASEMTKRELPQLSTEYIVGTLASIYAMNRLAVTEVDILTSRELREHATSWAKRLGFGKSRDVYRIKGNIACV